MIPAGVIPIRPHDDHAGCVIEARSEDDQGSWVIAVVVRVRVAMVIRSADDNLAGEVGVSKTQRDADPGLGLGEASSETKQKPDENDDAFHGCLPWCWASKEDACHAGAEP